MNRINFLKNMSLLSFSSFTLNLGALQKFSESLDSTEKMPVLFVGHGNPMNAIEENEFVKGFRDIAAGIPKPEAILCISAHWQTFGTQITAMKNPETIHDFGGFPEELYKVQYPAPGSPENAEYISRSVKKYDIRQVMDWGLDHGTWTVLKHFYPKADIPVLQLSLDYRKDPQSHYDLGSQLNFLRSKGFLIMGSGNIVHNLGMVAWDKLEKPGFGYDWALEADSQIKDAIKKMDHKKLIDFKDQGKSWDLAIPTSEHFLPLLYVLSNIRKEEKIEFFNEKAVAGSLTMSSVKIG
jgi:4,5-DOPA dioxygenase extradiol